MNKKIDFTNLEPYHFLDISNKNIINEILSPEYLESAFNFLHEDYLNIFYNDIKEDSDIENLEDYFHFINGKLDINIVYYEGNYKCNSLIFMSNSSNLGKINIINLIGKKLPYYIKSTFNRNDILVGLLNGDFIQVDESKILKNSLSSLTNLDFFIKSFIENEYNNNLKPDLATPKSIINFSNIKLNKDLYEFEEIINEINNSQFSAELNESLEAYKQKLYFVTAASLGSVLEHLLYLSINKNIVERDIHINENFNNPS